MSILIRKAFTNAADVAVTSSVVLITTGLTSPIAANEQQHFRAWLMITVGATGGVRLQVVVPAAGTIYNLSYRLNNTVAPSSTIATQVASAAFTNALANAGTHWVEIEGTVINGATAGNVDIQIAQNSSDVLTLTLKRGAVMEVLVGS